jgi:phage terminase large subunit-like protein
VIGGDGGGLDDLYGLCVAGREKGTDRWLYWFKAWCWPEVLEAPQADRAAAQGFAADGDLVICDERRTGRDDAEDYALPQDIREIVAICVR